MATPSETSPSVAEMNTVAALCVAAESVAAAGIAGSRSSVDACRRLIETVPIDRWQVVFDQALHVAAVRAKSEDRVATLRALSEVFGQFGDHQENEGATP